MEILVRRCLKSSIARKWRLGMLLALETEMYSILVTSTRTHVSQYIPQSLQITTVHFRLNFICLL